MRTPLNAFAQMIVDLELARTGHEAQILAGETLLAQNLAAAADLEAVAEWGDSA
jgi:hypothetical protein